MCIAAGMRESPRFFWFASYDTCMLACHVLSLLVGGREESTLASACLLLTYDTYNDFNQLRLVVPSLSFPLLSLSKFRVGFAKPIYS